jgi:hypothetical protein
VTVVIRDRASGFDVRQRKDHDMAKRKAATASRKAAATRAGAGRGRASAAKKKTAARKSAGKAARPSAAKRSTKKAVKPAGRAKTAGRAAPARKAVKAGKTAKGRKAAPKAPARKPSAKTAKTAKPVSRPRSAPESKAGKAAAAPVRKSPALNRERRVVPDDDEEVVQSPPSSLDLDRTASAARSGRRSLLDRFESHNETSPALTAGDVDADWESAYSVGDEAPGGDNPTPDQDIVDDIGKAVGIEYQDNEELKGADKVEKRDRNRWELDPASSEDWEDR